MEGKKTQCYGDVKYGIDITLEYSVLARHKGTLTEAKVKKSASLDCGFFPNDSFSFSKVVQFQTAANQMLELAKNLLANGTYVEFNLSKSAYEYVPEHDEVCSTGGYKSTLNQLSFDCWSFKGNCLDSDPCDEGACLYLSPDTQYTRTGWDICLPWAQDILKSLAEAGL